MSPAAFLERATRILFFTGKGGVGKTSLACATAVALARGGKKVLVVSTDPASNLDEVLETPLSGEPTEIAKAGGLFALNVDPEAAAAAYRERVVAPYRGVLPRAAITSMEEQLSGACTVEIAAFDEFTKLLGDPAATASFDHVIFDTAPTGHTLRLLKLPAAWTGFIATNTTGTSCLGPLAGLQAQKDLYEASLHALCNPLTTTVVLVSRPETSALAEADRTRAELSALGMTNMLLVANGLFRARDRADAAAVAWEARSERALAGMADSLARLPRLSMPLLPYAPMGVVHLGTVFEAPNLETASRPQARPSLEMPGLARLIDGLERKGTGVILVMGKGGVGKTTIAAAIAVALADRGHSVHLTTTDPAAHVHHAVSERIDGLRVSRVDPARVTQEYSAEVLAKAAPHLDAQGLALLEEDLRSPCTEEIAVFRAFADIVSGGQSAFVVIDTAPTGHTLLLLDSAEAYHREVSRTNSDMPEAVRRLLPRLRDATFTHVVLVTLPEATPVHEAARLQADLQRAGITPEAWVINQSLGANGFSDPLLVERAARELPFIREVTDSLAKLIAVVPWTPTEPVGVEGLRTLVLGVNEPVTSEVSAL
jgi:arsenite-transporting ATPase